MMSTEHTNRHTTTGETLIRVAIQFGASTWVDSMKPTEAKLYHSLGDGGGGRGMNENSCICTKVWTHDTGVLLFRQTKGSQKKSK